MGLYGKGVIFRSDSNGEDLEGFAGAGLYDSFLAEEPEHRLLDYRGEKLVWDQSFRDDLLRSIARVGLEVERVLGSPQDVEGAVAGGKFHVVQTRPQVGLSLKMTRCKGQGDLTSIGHLVTLSSSSEAVMSQRIRIGNQTAISCADRMEPFEFALRHGFGRLRVVRRQEVESPTAAPPAGTSRTWTAPRAPGSATPARPATCSSPCMRPGRPTRCTPSGVELLLRSLDFARDIGADLVNLHLYMDDGAASYVRSLEPVIRRAAAAGLRLSIENTPHTTPEDFNQTFACLRELDAAPPEAVGMCLDIGHANLCEATHNDLPPLPRRPEPGVAPHPPARSRELRRRRQLT